MRSDRVRAEGVARYAEAGKAREVRLSNNSASDDADVAFGRGGRKKTLMPHSKLFVALFVAGTFGLLSTTACGEKSGTATGSVCPQGSTLTYDTFGKSFFTTYCISCHVAGGQQSDTPLTTVEQIRARRSKIDEYAAAGPKAVNTVMPEEGTSPPEAERRKLGEWLACGAP